ncbi:MAG TPA: ATP-binding protein [Acidimicrobiia bacterium]|nr:ATP-binding protein [Acidimicrobiia bacterium]
MKTAQGLSRRPRLLVGATLAMLTAAAIATLIQPELGGAVGGPFLFVGYLISAWLFVSGAQSYHGRERLAWSLFGWAMLLGAAGLLAFTGAAIAGFDPPAYGPLDIFFIAAYFINIAAMWVLPHLDGSPTRRARIFIDGLVGSISLGLVAWVWFLNDVFTSVRDAATVEVVIGGIYPLVDVATLIVVIVVTLRRSTYRFDPRVLLLGAGFVSQAVADLIYFKQGVGGTFVEADPVYPLFLAAVAAFIIAGTSLRTRPPAREYAERRTPWWAMVAPYGAALTLGSMLARRMLDEQLSVETVELFVGVVIVVGLIILRQTLAIRENRELVEQQRTALVSSISHELRTPLTAMVGFLDILADPDQHIDVDARQEMIGIVNHQAIYMARIVSDLVMLNRSKPDLQLQQRLVDVEEVVSAAVASLDLDSLPGVESNIESGMSGFFDPSRIQQVLVNLLTNAARYGGPNRLLVARAVGNDLVFEVHDDGHGVPKRYELVIWDRFERGSHRYDATIPGSGIGLALVAMLVDAHHGTVSYRRSERLGGACFEVTLTGRAHSRRAEQVEPEVSVNS